MTKSTLRSNGGSGIIRTITVVALGVFTVASTASAQTDYYNTDAGRPLTVEDASATERYAFELQLAPIRLERSSGGRYRWEADPEIAYGILPRTQLELGLPFQYAERDGGSNKFGLAGISLSLLHNLNIETALPALAISGDALLPVGPFSPDEPIFTTKAIATRTFTWARFHVNAQYSFGDERTDEPEAGRVELSRWLAGLAVDRTFPLRSILVGAELLARESPESSEATEWSAAIGLRKQLSPAFNVDAGIGRELNGPDRTWFATFGFAHSFAIRSLMPAR